MSFTITSAGCILQLPNEYLNEIKLLKNIQTMCRTSSLILQDHLYNDCLTLCNMFHYTKTDFMQKTISELVRMHQICDFFVVPKFLQIIETILAIKLNRMNIQELNQYGPIIL